MPIKYFIQQSINSINTFSEWSGRLIAWLILIIVLIIVYQATMVALFSKGSVALQELQWHLFALVFLLSAAYTFKYDEHVRVDIIYQSYWMNDKFRAWINFMGGLFFLIPFCLLIIITSWSFAFDAFIYGESSPDPGGLPYRFLLKAAIPISFILLMLQGIAHILHNLLFLLDNKEDKT